MRRLSTSSVFLDVNVWLSLSTRDHLHFQVAWKWYRALPEPTTLVFCRYTQLAFLRLLTTQSVMGQGTLTQADAWTAYDQWIGAAGAEFTEEPADLESEFRLMTQAEQSSPKDWADSYLAAFSQASGIRLITFDRALAARAKGAVLLG